MGLLDDLGLTGPYPSPGSPKKPGVISPQEARLLQDKIASQAPTPSVDNPPFIRETFDIRDVLYGGSKKFPYNGFGIYYRKSGSAVGNRIYVTLAGRQVLMAPGDTLRAAFSAFSVERVYEFKAQPANGAGFGQIVDSNSGYGQVELIVFRTPDAEFRESDIGKTQPINFTFGDAAQAHNSVANTPPTWEGTASERYGVPLIGANGIRLYFAQASAAGSFTGGTIRLWYGTDYGAIKAGGWGQWYLSDEVYTMPTGAGYACVNITDIPVKYGWLWPECRLVTHSASSTIQVFAEVY